MSLMDTGDASELSSIRASADAFARDQEKQREAVAPLRSTVSTYGRPIVSAKVDELLEREEIAAEQKQASDELETVRAARAAEYAAQQPSVMVAQCNARTLSQFFSLFGDTVVDPSTTSLPAAFSSQFLGSAMHTPGMARRDGPQADTPAAEQARLRGVAQLIASSRHVSTAALESLHTCIDSVQNAQFWRVTNPETCSLAQLEQQIVIAMPNARACVNGARCMAMTELEPHPGGIRLPLKCVQRRSAWEAFLSTGSWLSEGEMGKSVDMCVPCMLQTYKLAARARQECGQPCGDIRFPLQVKSGCPGGFASTHLLSDSSMPVAWPDVNAHDYVSVQREIEYVFLDPVSRRTERRRERVYGYAFRAQVQFDESQHSCGADDYPMIAPRAALTVTTKEVIEPTLPTVLASNVRVRLAPELPHMPHIDEALNRMAVEFEVTMRACMSADPDSANYLSARFASFWQTAMMRVPNNALEALGNINDWTLPTHSITTAMMWRVGLCYMLEGTELHGNSNLTQFLDAHTPLQLFVLRRWTELKHAPSDRELVGDELVRITVESVCALLRTKQLYPVYAVPHMTPKEHHEVRVRLTHRRRTPAMDVVRRALLPPELVNRAGQTTRQQCRAALHWLGEQWQHDEVVASGGWLSPSLPDSLVSLLSRSPHGFQVWVARAVSLVALQTDFDDSIWLLGCITERWPWFARAAAVHTASARLPLDADPTAAAALDAGLWTQGPLSRETDMTPARPSKIPDDAPAWVRSVTGYRRFTAEYRTGALIDDAQDAVTPPVALGAHLFPDSLLNLHGPGVHSRRYLVLGALRCRVFELQRACSGYDRALGLAFQHRLDTTRQQADEAHEPAPHPSRHVVADIRRAMGRQADDDDDDREFVDQMLDDAFAELPLDQGASSIEVTRRMAKSWPDVSAAAEEAVAAGAELTESVGVELMRPLFGENGQMPSLYEPGADGPPVMGPPCETDGRAQVYAARCALFEGLELAYHAARTPDASDVFWYTTPAGSPLSNLDQRKPLANGVPCEDSLPDLSQYIGLNSLRESSAPSFLADTNTSRSWVAQVATVTYKACFMRDWPESHAKNCTHSEYATWAAQSLLVTALGTYRHSCRTLPFDRAMEFYANLRVQNGETVDGRLQLAKFLKRNTYMVMLAGQEFQMMTITGAGAESRLMRAAWPSFAYVQECWVPYRAERLRAVLAGSASLDSKERYACSMVRGPTQSAVPEPRVFRHMPNTWPLTMLDLFSRVEINRQTEAVIDSGEDNVNLLPRFVNKVPPEVKHLIAAFFSHTDPQEPVQLSWFARFGVSARGLTQLAMANAVYTVQGDSRVMSYLVEQMNDADFFFAWTTMHIMVLHRDTLVLPVPWSMAQRQYMSAQYRVANMHEPAPFTHMTFCHLLGCPGPQSYTVPMADGEHYGADETALAIDIGHQTCARNCTLEMFDRLVRRSKESPVQAGLDQMKTLRQALSTTADADERNSIQNDLSKLHEKLVTQQAKNVRATAAVAFNRPCNEARARQLQIVGAMVVQRNSVHARSTARVYTACPMCGMPTIYSMDRYGANGFTCGKCNVEERWALHGNWCVSCGTVEQGGALPELVGEAQAAARAARTQHHICGSTSQPRSLRSGASRRRHNELLRRQDLDDKKSVEVANGKMHDIDGKELDRSDTLAAPGPSRPTKAVADRQAEAKKKGPQKRVKERRKNIAATFELGRNRTNVHPCAVRMRMDRFSAMPLIDDRPGGLNTTAVFSVCGPCLTRVRHPTVSLANVLRQSQAEPEEIWVNGRRISTAGKPPGPRLRRRFVRRGGSTAPDSWPSAKRKVGESGKTIMLTLDQLQSMQPK